MNRRKKPVRQKPGSPAWMATWADMVSLLMCFFVLLFSLSNIDEARFREFAEAMAGRRILLGGALGTVFNESSGLLPDQSPPIPPRMPPDAPLTEDDIVDRVTARRGEMTEIAEAFRTYMAPYYDVVMPDTDTGADTDDGPEIISITDGISYYVDELGEFVRFTFDGGMLFDSGQAFLRPEAVEMIDYVAGFLARYPDNRIAIQGHTDSQPINTHQFPSNMHLSAARSISVFRRLVDYHGFDPWMLSTEGFGEYRPVDTNDTPAGRANNRRVEILIFAQQGELTVLDE